MATAAQTPYLEGPGAATWRPVVSGITPALTWGELTTTYEQWKPIPPKPKPHTGYY